MASFPQAGPFHLFRLHLDLGSDVLKEGNCHFSARKSAVALSSWRARGIRIGKAGQRLRVGLGTIMAASGMSLFKESKALTRTGATDRKDRLGMLSCGLS